jgi:hypothetical protein
MQPPRCLSLLQWARCRQLHSLTATPQGQHPGSLPWTDSQHLHCCRLRMLYRMHWQCLPALSAVHWMKTLLLLVQHQ